MLRIMWCLLLVPGLTHAQITYSPTPGGTYQPLDGATVSGPINVRAPCPPVPLIFTINGITANTENVPPCELMGDDALWDTTKLPDGRITIGATGQPDATFLLANASSVWSITWTPPITLEDGSPITDPLMYRIESAPAASGPWSEAWTGPQWTATLRAPSPGCFRVIALLARTESRPAEAPCVTTPAGVPPNVPVIVGVQKRDLWLVNGAQTGLRALYSRTATLSRGVKVGDVNVGPVNGDFARLECDGKDSFLYGGNRYSHLKTATSDGYTTGCYFTGQH